MSSRSAAERAATLAAEIRTITAHEAKALARLDREKLDTAARAAKAIEDVKAPERVLYMQLEAALLTHWVATVDSLITRHIDEPSRAVARELAGCIVATKARCTYDLGVEFDTPRHLTLGVCRRAIAKCPEAVNVLGRPDAWAAFGMSLIDVAGEVAKAGDDAVRIIAALNELEAAVNRRAAGACAGPDPYAVARFEVLGKHADYGSAAAALQEFEAYWRAKENRESGAEYSRHVGRARAWRAGEDVADASPEEVEAWSASSNEALFGPLRRAVRRLVTAVTS